MGNDTIGTEKTVAAKRSQSFAAAMLVLACLCWGAYFSLAKNWQDAATRCPGGELLASLTLMGVRTILALALFAVLRPGLFLRPTRREWRLGASLGLVSFVGNALQVWGLATTSPALSGFLTSLDSLWVPLLALALLRQPVGWPTWLGLVLGSTGIAVLGVVPGQGWRFGWGEGLTFLSSIDFAVLILLLDHAGRQVRSSQLTLGLIAVAGLPAVPLAVGLAASGSGVGPWLRWVSDMLRDPSVLGDVVLMTVLSTVLATILMSTFQPRVPASRAALIYLLQPVFAAALSVVLRNDAVSLRLVTGCGLILGANVVAGLPLWPRELADRRRGGGSGG